jgi:hypothetical protein
MVGQVAHHRQVILSTQSPYLVDRFQIEDVVVADLEGDATRLRVLNPDDYRDWLEEEDFGLSDLWLRNIIGGRPCSGCWSSARDSAKKSSSTTVSPRT